jgi:hypothetical protein
MYVYIYIYYIYICRLRIFEDGKHNLHLRFPDEFNDAVAEFLMEDDDKEESSREFVAVPKKGAIAAPASTPACR